MGEGEYWGRGSVLSLRASPPQARRGKFNLSKWLCTIKCSYSVCGDVLRLKIISVQDQDPRSLFEKWYGPKIDFWPSLVGKGLLLPSQYQDNYRLINMTNNNWHTYGCICIIRAPIAGARTARVISTYLSPLLIIITFFYFLHMIWYVVTNILD